MVPTNKYDEYRKKNIQRRFCIKQLETSEVRIAKQYMSPMV